MFDFYIISILAVLILTAIFVYLYPEQNKVSYTDKVLDREFKNQQIAYFERSMRIWFLTNQVTFWGKLFKSGPLVSGRS